MPDDDIDTVNVDQLARAVDACEGRMAFLIGAGASKAASIPTTGELIEQWKQELYENETGEENYDKSDVEEWAEERKPDDEDLNPYGYWFEKLYPSRGARKEFIQELVEDHEPTVGIVVLASMMNDGYVPLTVTPNFDDLLYDAFYRYLEDKPLLVDHNAIAPEFRLTEDRPAIIKLHGDYLYDNLQNTDDETRKLEENMEEVLTKAMNEYGLIVVGYGGRDESIMGVLKDNEVPDNGLYWCSLSTDRSNLSDDARKILEKDNAFLIEIDGSEDLFLKFARELNIDTPTRKEIMERAEERADSLSKLRQEREEETDDKEEEELLELWEMRDKAYKYIIDDENKKSLKMLDKITQSESADERDYLTRGVVHSRLENYNEAEEDYVHAIKIDPEYAVAYNNYGTLLYQKLGEPKKARNMFKKAIEINPKYADVYYNYGNLLDQKLDEPEKAKEMYEKAIEIDPTCSNAYYNYGNLLDQKLDEPEKAKEMYEKAIEVSPEYPDAYNNYGTLLSGKLNEPEKAKEMYEKAIEINSEFDAAYQNKAELHITEGEYSKALENAQTAVKVSDSIDSETRSLMLTMIAKILLNESISEEEERYRDLCSVEFVTTWSFKQLNNWLEDADIDDDKERRIREIIDLLREQKPRASS